ncbi:unnamed protein product [Cladocopium goreaui]|uniref:non-specific serine/threonine protein kinase n=1 Tax=Cladocopium goreaui TaxID=2562237 RepID=A0A9P1CK38_9DINO|nr:unnamed protein product [Cladocopium goreaui]
MEDDSEEEREEERRWVARVLKFGRCKTAKLLARGGMGAAFKVTVRDRSARALKLALPMASGEGDVFLKEAMARHGIRYIEMELLDGDLHTEIKKHRLGHLPPEMSGKFLKHITSGLMHLHSRRLIHRDIKPGNIFVSGSIAKIGDFGLTVEMGPNVTVAGTPNYLPYDIWNSVVPMTIRADLWGLGCVLYEMMCGELLYEDLPTEDVTIPRVNWPAFNGSLQTAFYQLMSTPSHVRALTVVGELSELCGDWVQPKTGAAIERAWRKGNADPQLNAMANQERKNRRRKAKAKKKAERGKVTVKQEKAEDDGSEEANLDHDNDDGEDLNLELQKLATRRTVGKDDRQKRARRFEGVACVASRQFCR